MKFSLIIITVLTVFTLVSCSPSRQDSVQTPQVPVLAPAPVQPAPVSKEPAQPVEDGATVLPSAEPTNSEVMLNPPHGEPFHRCDIPVGAPLNSSPANTARQSTDNPVQVTAPQSAGSASGTVNNSFAPTIENAMRMNSGQTRSTTAPASGTKPQLNPPHGQPWHRCDIAVGSPLP